VSRANWSSIAGLLLASLLLGIMVVMGVTGGIDHGVAKTFSLGQGRSPDGLILVTQWVSWLGDGERRAIWLVVLTGWLAWKRDWRAAGTMLVVPVLASIGSTLMKDAFGRPRPDVAPHLDVVTSMSYPSGHAVNAVAILLLAAVLIPKRNLRAWVAGAAALAVMIGLSRVMLNVHWASDVVGGWLFGLAFALFGIGFVRNGRSG
jgi:membrane-associated phospholipid phosphatase